MAYEAYAQFYPHSACRTDGAYWCYAGSDRYIRKAKEISQVTPLGDLTVDYFYGYSNINHQMNGKMVGANQWFLDGHAQWIARNLMDRKDTNGTGNIFLWVDRELTGKY
jgi:prepilin-type processing-associated H-X9-DG protein